MSAYRKIQRFTVCIFINFEIIVTRDMIVIVEILLGKNGCKWINRFYP